MRRMGVSVRRSLRQLKTIFVGVLLTKIVMCLIGVHYQPLVEVPMETVIGFIAHSILQSTETPSPVANLRVAAEVLLRIRSMIPPVFVEIVAVKTGASTVVRFGIP